MSKVMEEPIVGSDQAEVEKDPVHLLEETIKANEEMWSARFAFEEIRRSKNLDTITHEDLAVRDDWIAKREKLVALLRQLPSGFEGNIDLTPPIPSDSPRSSAGIAEDITISPEISLPEAETETDTRSANRDHTNMTMAEIDSMIFNAKATGKSPGIGPEGLSYWEEQKRLKQAQEDEERERTKKEVARLAAEEAAAREAEEKEKQARELKDKIAELVTRLSQRLQYLNDEIVPNLERAKNTARSMEQSGWENDKKKTEKEISELRSEVKSFEKDLEKLSKGLGQPFRSALKSSFEEAKKIEDEKDTSNEEDEVVGEWSQFSFPEEVSDGSEKSDKKRGSLKAKFKKAYGWFKERVKSFKEGAFLPGVGEVIQAERMRTGTKEVSINADAMSTLIKKEWNIDDPDVVHEIVNEVIKTERKIADSMEDDNFKLDNDDFGMVMDSVIMDRKIENNKEKDYIIKTAIEELKENLKLRKARGQATSEAVLTPENIEKIEAEMRTELNKISDGAAVRDVKSFTKVMRNNLDKYWWLRYLYGGAEIAALGGLGYAWLNRGVVQLPNIARPLLPIPEELAPVGIPEDSRLMLDHYWGVAKDLWMENGVADPTNQQIMDVTKVLAQDNNVAVPPWDVAGDKLHTQLPVHWVLVKGGVSIIRAYLGS